MQKYIRNNILAIYIFIVISAIFFIVYINSPLKAEINVKNNIAYINLENNEMHNIEAKLFLNKKKIKDFFLKAKESKKIAIELENGINTLEIRDKFKSIIMQKINISKSQGDKIKLAINYSDIKENEKSKIIFQICNKEDFAKIKLLIEDSNNFIFDSSEKVSDLKKNECKDFIYIIKANKKGSYNLKYSIFINNNFYKENSLIIKVI